MESPKIVFKEYCKENGMRFTPEREVIIEEAYRKDVHFDIDSLFLRIRNRHPEMKLAKGTIYRTLPHLISAGLIRESLMDDGHVCYEHTLGHQHHDHLKCIGCGEIFEFYDKEIDNAQKRVCDKRTFNMLWHIHVIGGYCSKCQKKESDFF